MDNPEMERQFEALEIPRHRLSIVRGGVDSLAQNSVVRAGFALRNAMNTPESADNVLRPQFPNYHIAENVERNDMLDQARQDVKDAA